MLASRGAGAAQNSGGRPVDIARRRSRRRDHFDEPETVTSKSEERSRRPSTDSTYTLAFLPGSVWQ
jgi:hypothetical protein